MRIRRWRGANIRIKGGLLKTEGDDAATRGRYVADGTVVLEGVTLEGTYRFLTTVTSPGSLSTLTLDKKNYNKGSITARFAVGSNTELSGGGEIIGESGSFFSLGLGTTFTNVDNLIRGSGTITNNNVGSLENAVFKNRGIVRAEGAMTFSGSQFQLVNSGRIEAMSGVTLALPTSTTLPVLNSDAGVAGTIHAASGGIITFRSIDGGILSTEGTGVIRGTFGSIIKDLHNVGTLEVGALIPQGTIVNDGVIKGSLQASSPYVRFDGTGRWEGSFTNFCGVFVNGPTHTILGTEPPFKSRRRTARSQTRGRCGPAMRRALLLDLRWGRSPILAVHSPAGHSLTINSSLAVPKTAARCKSTATWQCPRRPGCTTKVPALSPWAGKLTLNETRLRNRAGREDFWERPDRGANDVRARSS